MTINIIDRDQVSNVDYFPVFSRPENLLPKDGGELYLAQITPRKFANTTTVSFDNLAEMQQIFDEWKKHGTSRVSFARALVDSRAKRTEVDNVSSLFL